MPKKAPTIKFGGLYRYPSVLALWDHAEIPNRTMYLAADATFVPIEYVANKRWARYGGYHRCMKILTESGIIGYVFLRTSELTEVTS